MTHWQGWHPKFGVCTRTAHSMGYTVRFYKDYVTVSTPNAKRPSMNTSNTIKAIETTYNGIRFRSRLEARWAVFMDALGVKWEYEPEGFTDGELCYLPDFWLPDLGCYIEVKPIFPTREELRKAKIITSGTGYGLLFAIGKPETRAKQSESGCLFWPTYPGDEWFDFVYCNRCHCASIAMCGTQDFMECCDDARANREKHDAAVFAANNHRFGGR